jgi:hypothetical protein
MVIIEGKAVVGILLQIKPHGAHYFLELFGPDRHFMNGIQILAVGSLMMNPTGHVLMYSTLLQYLLITDNLISRLFQL